MIYEIKWKEKKWIYAFEATEEEIKDVASTYNIHPVVFNELLHPTLRPKVDRFPTFLYLILHFPVFHAEAKTSLATETDFVVGQDFFITASYEKNIALNEFFDKLEKNIELQDKIFSEGIGMLFYKLIEHLYDFSMRELDHIKVKIDSIDFRLASREDQETIEEIFVLRRDILNFRRAIKPHETVIESFESLGTDFFGKEMQPYFKDLTGDYYKVWNILENHKETIEALYDTNISYISLRSNEIMRKLTLMAFVTFPMTLIAALFSMKISPDEFFGRPYDFAIVLTVIAVAIVTMLTIFKRRRWF